MSLLNTTSKYTHTHTKHFSVSITDVLFYLIFPHRSPESVTIKFNRNVTLSQKSGSKWEQKYNWKFYEKSALPS